MGAPVFLQEIRFPTKKKIGVQPAFFRFCGLRVAPAARDHLALFSAIALVRSPSPRASFFFSAKNPNKNFRVACYEKSACDAFVPAS
ncbi:MAG: hypothetical protein GY822_30070 [Deltaproteobacteria bacterium]|nr:hypothetical protein [Deltaproteobacteria bacterium]